MVYDVHYVFSGFVRMEADSPEEARKLADEWLHQVARDTDARLYTNIEEPDGEYATDVISLF